MEQDQGGFDDFGQGDNIQSGSQNASISYAQSDPQDSQNNAQQLNNQQSNPDADSDSGSYQSQQQRFDMQIIQQPIPQKANEKRITSPFLTKYQKARIIGVRAVQISKNSPLYLTADSKSLQMWDPLTIAQKQLAQQAIPFIIRRYLPDGSYQDWKLSQLKTLD